MNNDTLTGPGLDVLCKYLTEWDDENNRLLIGDNFARGVVLLKESDFRSLITLFAPLGTRLLRGGESEPFGWQVRMMWLGFMVRAVVLTCKAILEPQTRGTQFGPPRHAALAWHSLLNALVFSRVLLARDQHELNEQCSQVEPIVKREIGFDEAASTWYA